MRETSHLLLTSRLGGVLSAARPVECTRPKSLVMGLPCVFVIGLLASAIKPRLPVIGADVRQIREPRSGETANAFDAQGPDGPFLQDLGSVFERRGAHGAPQTIPLRVEQRSPLDQCQHIRTGLAESAHDQAPNGAKLLHAPFDRALHPLRSPVPPLIDLASLGMHFPVDRTRSPGDRSVSRIQYPVCWPDTEWYRKTGS